MRSLDRRVIPKLVNLVMLTRDGTLRIGQHPDNPLLPEDFKLAISELVPVAPLSLHIIQARTHPECRGSKLCVRMTFCTRVIARSVADAFRAALAVDDKPRHVFQPRNERIINFDAEEVERYEEAIRLVRLKDPTVGLEIKRWRGAYGIAHSLHFIGERHDLTNFWLVFDSLSIKK